MPGRRVTRQQMRLFMEFRQGHPQRLAAAKSGISERTARRIEANRHLPASPVANYPLRRQGHDCKSAWGPGADRRCKYLNRLQSDVSRDDAEQH